MINIDVALLIQMKGELFYYSDEKSSKRKLAWLISGFNAGKRNGEMHLRDLNHANIPGPFLNWLETVISIKCISAMWQPATFCQVEKNKELALKFFIFLERYFHHKCSLWRERITKSLQNRFYSRLWLHIKRVVSFLLETKAKSKQVVSCVI